MSSEITAKDYLQNLRTLDYDLAIYELESKKLEERICSYCSHYGERVDCSDTSDKTAELAVQLASLKREANETCRRWVDLKIDTLKVIDQIEDQKYQRILYLYYFQRMTIADVAEFLDITYQWAAENKKRAVEEFDRLRHEMGLCGVCSDNNISQVTH